MSVQAAILLAGVVAGCASDPLPYSPNYSRINLTDEVAVQSAHVVKTDDAKSPRPVYQQTRHVSQTRSVIVPDACITPDTAEQPVYLPSGCANNLNLQLMVERKGDLFHGRKPGPAMASPSVRAAQRYLYGGTEWEQRAGRLEPRDPSTPAATTPPQAATNPERR